MTPAIFGASRKCACICLAMLVRAFVLALLLCAVAVRAQLTVPADAEFTDAQQWMTVDSPVTLNGSLYITRTGSLTIAPGVTVWAAPDTVIYVDNVLQAVGTEDMLVRRC